MFDVHNSVSVFPAIYYSYHLHDGPLVQIVSNPRLWRWRHIFRLRLRHGAEHLHSLLAPVGDDGMQPSEAMWCDLDAGNSNSIITLSQHILRLCIVFVWAASTESPWRHFHHTRKQHNTYVSYVIAHSRWSAVASTLCLQTSSCCCCVAGRQRSWTPPAVALSAAGGDDGLTMRHNGAWPLSGISAYWWPSQEWRLAGREPNAGWLPSVMATDADFANYILGNYFAASLFPNVWLCACLLWQVSWLWDGLLSSCSLSAYS